MVNLYLIACQARECLRPFASGLRMIERAGVAGRFGFIPQVLRNVLGYSFKGIRL